MADPKDSDKFKEISDYIKELFLTKTRDEWFDFLGSRDIPVGKVLAMDEAFKDPHMLHREMVIEVDSPTEGKVKQVGIPIKLSETPGKVRTTAPLFGEHTDEILTGLGYTPQEINELRLKGVVK
jgi:crotonobetainyl-CoA:carnitine CoA-transferase CaiB-like acyl-CoA transferase